MRSISLVMPLYNAAHLLDRVVPPIRRALDRGALAEVIVVDDSSSDAGPERMRKEGFRVLPSGGRLGPGACRNLGAGEASGDVLLFVDSDVVMHDDVPERMRDALASSPDVVAVFGSYDDDPAAPGIVSRYRNLLHHHIHHQGRGEASTFWAGCGAVLRQAFHDARGFDFSRYPFPSIEDIELGQRLRRAGGRILLRPEIQGTHLKRWTLRSMVHTDVFRRALPWSRLLLHPGNEDLRELNLTTGERARAGVAALFWLALAAAPLWPWSLAAALGLLLLGWAVNRRLFALVRRRTGITGMAAAVVLHQLYYLYSGLTYGYCLVERRLTSRPARTTPPPAPRPDPR